MKPLIQILFVVFAVYNNCDALSFANYYGSSMVLQHGPARAGVWGYASLEREGEMVTVTMEKSLNFPLIFEEDFLNNTEPVFRTKVKVRRNADGSTGVWSVLLPAINAGPAQYTLTATLSDDVATLDDVVFGEVWLCSGQSNMAMETYKTLNGSQEMAGSSDYNNIRIFKVGRTYRDEPIYDVEKIAQEWTRPSAGSVRGFSSLCWSYGRKLHEYHGKPVGLVQSSWGGTSIESWSRPEALAKCDVVMEDNQRKNDPSHLWNGMIHPLLNMTITGAIWYQGEWNARRIDFTRQYECTFPAMIQDWREEFSAASNGQTDQQFPFGFVQLAGQKKDYKLVDGFPHLRWKQTANLGKVPNQRMEKTFMAVAMDLPDFHSPYRPNHPRDKNTIANRMLMGYKSVILKEDFDDFSVIPTAYRVDAIKYQLEIEFASKKMSIEVKGSDGFEICCSDNKDSLCDPMDTRWLPIPIQQNTKTSVTLDTTTCQAEYILGHRYAWRTNPCEYKNCAIYTARNALPLPVYVKSELLKTDAKWRPITFE